MPKKLEEIIKTPIEKLDSSVLANVVIENVKELDRDDFIKAIERLPPFPALLAMKKRCEEANDKEACIAYDIAVNGDKTAPGGVSYLGLRGLWLEEKNEFAKKYLEMLGEL